MSDSLDPRLTPARPDLAAKFLEDRVRADRYTEAVRHRLVQSASPLRQAPDVSLPRLTEALYGEEMDVYEIRKGWAWGQLVLDGYVGWMEADGLVADSGFAFTDIVSVPLTHCYAEPDNVRASVLQRLSCGSRLDLEASEGGWSRLRPMEGQQEGGWIYTAHTRPAQKFVTDFVSVAKSYLHVPYVWGGRQATGLDCSALVQVSLAAAGIVAPRDTDLQEKSLGISLNLSGFSSGGMEGLRRGDLVFWPGHVGIMTGAKNILHANAHHMAVREEALAEASDRIKGVAGCICNVRRLSFFSGESGYGQLD